MNGFISHSYSAKRFLVGTIGLLAILWFIISEPMRSFSASDPSRAVSIDQLQTAYPEIAHVFAGDPGEQDRFGFAIAISGNTLVVGAPNEDGGPGDPIIFAGAAYVFERNEGGPDHWGQTAKLTASDAQQEDRFGGAVAIYGDTIVVGAAEEDGGPGDPIASAGAAYVFERNQGGPDNWGQTVKLVAGEPQVSAIFGDSVTIFGDTIAASAPSEDSAVGESVPNVGAVYIFERDQGGPGDWGQSARIVDEDGQLEDYFGRDVDLFEDTLVVGAFKEDGGPGDPITDAGAVFIFDRNLGGADNWGQSVKLTASDAEENDNFGRTVAVDQDTVVVGAYYTDIFTNWSSVYTYERNLGGPENWGESAILFSIDPQSIVQGVGLAVTVGGDIVLVADQYEDGGPGDPLPNAGTVYVFKRDPLDANSWVLEDALMAGDAQIGDQFGWSVAIDGDALAAGAVHEDGGPGDPIFDSGSAYVFYAQEGPTPTPTSTLEPTASHTPTATATPTGSSTAIPTATSTTTPTATITPVPDLRIYLPAIIHDPP